MPAVNAGALKSSENTAVKASVLMVKVAEELFHIFSFRMLILRAGTFFNGERYLFYKGFYLLFLCENKGTDKSELLF